MAREIFGNGVAHDVIEVELPVFLGQKRAESPPDPIYSLFERFKRSIVDRTVIFVGEIPHSSFDTAYDIPKTEPNRSILEKIRSRLSGKVSFSLEQH